ncbi:MAG: hypothetical protein WC707_06815 [Candidatus Babeliaceae bacterium]|jgi:hypothetical protein
MPKTYPKYYKLWVQFIPGTEKFNLHIKDKGKYNYLSNHDFPKEKQYDAIIKNIFEKLKNQIQKAILYDRETNEPIETLK